MKLPTHHRPIKLFLLPLPPQPASTPSPRLLPGRRLLRCRAAYPRSIPPFLTRTPPGTPIACHRPTGRPTLPGQQRYRSTSPLPPILHDTLSPTSSMPVSHWSSHLQQLRNPNPPPPRPPPRPARPCLQSLPSSPTGCARKSLRCGLEQAVARERVCGGAVEVAWRSTVERPGQWEGRGRSRRQVVGGRSSRVAAHNVEVEGGSAG